MFFELKGDFGDDAFDALSPKGDVTRFEVSVSDIALLTPKGDFGNVEEPIAPPLLKGDSDVVAEAPNGDFVPILSFFSKGDFNEEPVPLIGLLNIDDDVELMGAVLPNGDFMSELGSVLLLPEGEVNEDTDLLPRLLILSQKIIQGYF